MSDQHVAVLQEMLRDAEVIGDEQHGDCTFVPIPLERFRESLHSALAALQAQQGAEPVAWQELAEEAVYVGLCIGYDCAAKLADLQEAGIYKPRCDDGKPSNANARKDAERIGDIYKRGLAMLRENPAAPTGAPR